MGGNSDDVFASIVGYTIVKYFNQRAASFRFLAPLSSHYFHPIYSFLHLFFCSPFLFYLPFPRKGWDGHDMLYSESTTINCSLFFYNFNVWLRFK